jgi:hypothetical protein
MPSRIPVSAIKRPFFVPWVEPELSDDTIHPLGRLIEAGSFRKEGDMIAPNPVAEPDLIPNMGRHLSYAILRQGCFDESSCEFRKGHGLILFGQAMFKSITGTFPPSAAVPAISAGHKLKRWDSHHDVSGHAKVNI